MNDLVLEFIIGDEDKSLSISAATLVKRMCPDDWNEILGYLGLEGVLAMPEEIVEKMHDIQDRMDQIRSIIGDDEWENKARAYKKIIDRAKTYIAMALNDNVLHDGLVSTHKILEEADQV